MQETLLNFLAQSGFGQFQWGNGVMILVGCLFIYLAIGKKFEPLLLVPIGFGILIGNIPYDTRALSLGVYDGPVSEADLHYYKITQEKQNDGKTVVRPTGEVIHDTQEGKKMVEHGQAVMVNNHVKLVYYGDVNGPGIIDVGQGRQIFVLAAADDHRYPSWFAPRRRTRATLGFSI